MIMNPAPPKPPATADRKALAAYYSELRRWAKALERWEADLDQREADLADYSYDEDEDECECGPQDALEGCDCPMCVNYRALLRQQNPQPQPPQGDEVVWLEKLYALSDKRRKKKQ